MCNTFTGNSNATPGTSLATKGVTTKDGKTINLDLWDTSGQEKYRALTTIFYKDADCIVLGYDITNKSSFEDIKTYWAPELRENAPQNLGMSIFFKFLFFSSYFGWK